MTNEGSGIYSPLHSKNFPCGCNADENQKVDADETAPCHVCGWKDGYHDKRCSGYLVDPETGEPIPTHNAEASVARSASAGLPG